MGQQQMLLVILGVMIVGFAIAIGISLFSGQSVASNRDSMINDLNHLAAMAYQFRLSIRQMGGGQGDYSTFSIPTHMSSNSNGAYSVVAAQMNRLTLKAVSTDNPSNTIQVTVDSNGRIGNLTYGGDFQ